MNQGRRDWNDMARLDPLWAILSDPTKRHGGWEAEEFLATGRQEIDALLETGKRWGLPERRREALDFGCGVGRLTRALAEHFDRALGVDISEVMVSRARVLNEDVPRSSFHVLDAAGLGPFAAGSFDCIYSRIALQHIPDRRITEANLGEFVRLVADGGLLVFQLPSTIPLRRRLQIRPLLYAALRPLGVSERFLYEQLGLHPIRMRSIPERDVIAILERAGARILQVERTVHAETGIEDRTYWATRSR